MRTLLLTPFLIMGLAGSSLGKSAGMSYPGPGNNNCAKLRTDLPSPDPHSKKCPLRADLPSPDPHSKKCPLQADLPSPTSTQQKCPLGTA
jgi:hypothetical protein